jgi:glycosyltransferase involved in cell wall biosynthesis
MLIGIDGNEANVEQRVGVHQYSYEILWGLYRENARRKKQHDFTIYLKDFQKDDLPKEKSWWRYKVLSGKGAWILKKLMPALLMRPRSDVFFTPSHYLPPLTLMPKVFTIHDLGYLRFSEQFKKYDFWQLKCWTAISISISKYIIAVSNSTRKDIVRHYPFASKKIKVIHHGYDKKRFRRRVNTDFVRRVKRKYKIDGDYILFLSTLKPSKNIEGLVEAFKDVKSKIPNTKLVIAGKKGWLYQSIYEKAKMMLNDVVFTGYVHENDKPALISGAKVFILPSFWEGFGMDVLEAFGCGTPVIVSDVASLPEVAGDAAVYIDPYKNESIVEAIYKVLSMSKRGYNKLVQKGFKQAEKFSWEISAHETLKILEEASK